MADNTFFAGLPLETLLIIGGLFTVSALCPSIAAFILIRRKKWHQDE
jgi:hypothetical protein